MSVLEDIWVVGAEVAAERSWRFTSECMLRALYGGGSDTTYYSDSYVSKMIKEDSTYKSKINEFKTQYQKSGTEYFKDSFAFDSGNLFMSIHNVNITARIQSDGNMKVTLDDEYDFTKMWNVVEYFKTSTFKGLGALANNYGTFLQSADVLKPFHIYIYILMNG
jgi:hypothetical protein